MHSRFFPGKEVETKTGLTKNGWTHNEISSRFNGICHDFSDHRQQWSILFVRHRKLPRYLFITGRNPLRKSIVKFTPAKAPIKPIRLKTTEASNSSPSRRGG